MKRQRDQLPLYFEGLQLRRRLVLAGWPLAVASAALGVTFAGMARSQLVNGVGLILPTAEPEALREALAEARTASRARSPN